MAGELRTRNQAFLVKIESSEGVDAAPTASDGLWVESVTSGIGVGQIPASEVTGRLDAGAPQVIGAPTTWTVQVRLRGMSGAATISNFPRADALLQAAGFERIFTGAVANTPLASGTSIAMTLASPFAATQHAYNGMPMVLSGPNHAGKVAVVRDYLSSRFAELCEAYSPDLSNSNSAALPANIQYRPRSSGLVTVTCYHYIDGLLRKLIGARATMTLAWDTAGIPVATFTLTGSWGGETDAAIVTVTPPPVPAPLFVQGSGTSPAFTFDLLPVGLSSLSLDIGNSLVSPPNPNTLNGFDIGLLTARAPTLTLDPQRQLVATNNIFGKLVAGTQVSIVARGGAAVGNRMIVAVPNAQMTAAPDVDREGVLAANVSAAANLTLSGGPSVTLTFY